MPENLNSIGCAKLHFASSIIICWNYFNFFIEFPFRKFEFVLKKPTELFTTISPNASLDSINWQNAYVWTSYLINSSPFNPFVCLCHFRNPSKSKKSSWLIIFFSAGTFINDK